MCSKNQYRWIISTVPYTSNSGQNYKLKVPFGLAIDAEGNLYITDSEAHCIWKVDTIGIITPVVGIPGEEGNNADPIPTGQLATELKLSYPTKVMLDGQGNLYFLSKNDIYKVNPAGTIAKLDRSSIIFNGVKIASSSYSITGLAADLNGNIYSSESSHGPGLYSGRISVLDASGFVSTVAGTGGYSTKAPELEWLGLLPSPGSLALDSKGNVYILDSHYAEGISVVTPLG